MLTWSVIRLPPWLGSSHGRRDDHRPWLVSIWVDRLPLWVLTRGMASLAFVHPPNRNSAVSPPTKEMARWLKTCVPCSVYRVIRRANDDRGADPAVPRVRVPPSTGRLRLMVLPDLSDTPLTTNE